ncbi:hypothetical protein [Secundilactobacillus collinoides]|uniref:Uncharacterized protein n=2 Tax=Secundilactobacillus collinoides TaxID=33960 RepID=A0A0R2B703_SECCO|nr:hypothetical protein [Secundilactobacillus collinoides]KRM75261.1 hypothetical protein FC82_GL002447 [Secundilactobacillus collinoides DSM 20515 = JCM 1123]KZL35872.1 hypothetical protein TY91_14780 [Secundilactobacillus collinoides]
MTTLFVHQTDAEQPVKLSDGTAGLVERCKTPDGNNGYLFKFFDQLHGDFWCDAITDGETVTVDSINRHEQFQMSVH